jgi:regulation of enolase protein 1 (concanavalin A-like superfamily)
MSRAPGLITVCLAILIWWFPAQLSTADETAHSEILFSDLFRGKLGPGWSWIREHPEAWRTTGEGLEIRIEPGNMWGPQNDARNVLVRAAPEFEPGNTLEISVKVKNQPTNQYEQVDLVWFYDDKNMVKIGQELVDGQLSIVMGREENDKTRTIAIIPKRSEQVRLQLSVTGNRIRGQFATSVGGEWQKAGECDLPSYEGKPKIAIQCYQGLKEVEHWAKLTEFRVARTSGQQQEK